MWWGSRTVAVKELDQGKSGYSFLVGEADVGGDLHSRFSKVLKLPSVLLGGVRVARLRANSGITQVSVGSNNIGLGGQSRVGSLEQQIPGKHSNSADALFTSP